jgi:hypothetical protein
MLGCESGTQVGTSDGKNRKSIIWRYCPFKDTLKSKKQPWEKEMSHEI